MVYVTGDTHGDKKRFQSPRIKKLTKQDTLIICGDFGFVWDGGREENKLLRWLGKRKYTILFVEGTHENFQLLKEYPEEELYGGKVRKLGKNLYQALRGQVYQIENRNFFMFGGGDPDDSQEHIEGVNWLMGEQATEEELRTARDTLERYEWNVDYIITHDAPSQVKGFLNMQDDRFTLLETFLDEVAAKCRFKRWFFGHYHLDKIVSPSYTALFRNMIPLDK